MDLRGPTSKGREGKDRSGEGREGKGEKGEGMEGTKGGRGKEGKGEGCVMAFGEMDAPEVATNLENLQYSGISLKTCKT